MNNEVIVTNRNPEIYSDGWHGMKFDFKPNVKVSVPLAAAVHMFGFNKQDKTETLRRCGVVNHPDGKQWLSNFDMEYVEYIRKDDAAEIEQLKIDLEAKQTEIDTLVLDLKAAQASVEQLTEQLDKASKTAKKEKIS